MKTATVRLLHFENPANIRLPVMTIAVHTNTFQLVETVRVESSLNNTWSSIVFSIRAFQDVPSTGVFESSCSPITCGDQD